MKIKILAKPAFSNRKKNPYNYLLYEHLSKKRGCKIVEFSLSNALFKSYDIFHLHWPEVFFTRESRISAYITAWAFVILMGIMKTRNIRIIWTVHNLRSHDFSSKRDHERRLESFVMDRLTARADACIVLSEQSIGLAKSAYPNLGDTPFFVIPHGHYREIYPDSIPLGEARRLLDIPQNVFVLSFFGQIRSYKNVPELIYQFLKLEREDVYLLIAGKVSPEKLGETIVELTRKTGERIITVLRFIPDEEVQVFFNASNLLVIPYRQVLNSGSVLLSLSFDVPVLVPGTGSLSELKDTLGEEWIMTYEGSLSANILENAIEQTERRNTGKCTKLHKYSWDHIADKTYQAYKQILSES